MTDMYVEVSLTELRCSIDSKRLSKGNDWWRILTHPQMLRLDILTDLFPGQGPNFIKHLAWQAHLLETMELCIFEGYGLPNNQTLLMLKE